MPISSLTAVQMCACVPALKPLIGFSVPKMFKALGLSNDATGSYAAYIGKDTAETGKSKDKTGMSDSSSSTRVSVFGKGDGGDMHLEGLVITREVEQTWSDECAGSQSHLVAASRPGDMALR